MKLRKLAVICIAALVIGSLSAIADTSAQKIAVIDVQKVVSSSKEVKVLKKEQAANQKEIQNYIKKAQADIKKQSTPEDKKLLAEKYEKQLAEKKSAYAKDYALKVKKIDNVINAKIAQQARNMGYTMIISKKSVIMGGDDITDAVIKVVK